MGQISLISAGLLVLTDGANFKKWGQILKMGANLADFRGFCRALPILTNFFDYAPPCAYWDKKAGLIVPAMG